jgi:hypothetical protein
MLGVLALHDWHERKHATSEECTASIERTESVDHRAFCFSIRVAAAAPEFFRTAQHRRFLSRGDNVLLLLPLGNGGNQSRTPLADW